jgi:E3 ubiquitin-protein ligase TRIP12
VLCSRLLAIEYLDVAEQVTQKLLRAWSGDHIYLEALYPTILYRMQCLQAFEKISRRQPTQCLQAGMINAVLAYIDFFAASIQVRILKKSPLKLRIEYIC